MSVFQDYNGLLAAPLDVAAVTAAEAINATTPIGNLFDDRPRRLVEATGPNLTLDIDMGGATEISLVAVLFTNAGADATWSVKLADTQAGLAAAAEVIAAGTTLWASPSGARYARRHGFGTFAQATKQWIRITISGGTIEGGLLQVGRLVIAKALQPGWNYEQGADEARQPVVDQKQSRTGQTSRRLWQRRRVLGLTFPDLTREERYGELELIAIAADVSPILIIQEPAPDAYRMETMFYGWLTIQVKKRHDDTYIARLQLTEET